MRCVHTAGEGLGAGVARADIGLLDGGSSNIGRIVKSLGLKE